MHSITSPVKTSRRNAFTLIELLVVIAIIAIISGLMFVGVAKAKEASRRSKAKVQIKQLEKAFTAYFDEYGEWPKGLIGYDKGDDSSMENLTGIQLGENCAKLLRGEDINGLNPQKIVFYAIPDGVIRRDGHGTVGFVDPWGHCFKYMMDFNDDGVLRVLFSNSGGDDNLTNIDGVNIAIWSQGPDGIDSQQDDNITSWLKQ